MLGTVDGLPLCAIDPTSIAVGGPPKSVGSASVIGELAGCGFCGGPAAGSSCIDPHVLSWSWR